ncbi:hypothetical protein CCDG5_0919 [[Clostridium] cellulosi]|uniref:Amino acid adenylation domain-containing protein n=1 Tax=[Clostridium] cellulosi TaxID=29343 RepID=A0A078KNJ1_9FIRM|nr:hypothetical protein CCDG5_0919 [[Clostridium] cellulosi]
MSNEEIKISGIEPVEDFYKNLLNLHIKLWLDKGSLRYKAPKGVVTSDILKKIAARKDELISLLKAQEEKQILFSPITPVEEKEYYPLSAAQRRMFVLNQLDKESTAYNTTLALKIEGDLDESRLTQVFEKLIQRHESLRTTFEMVGDEPVQIIHKAADFAMEHAEAVDEEEIESIIKDFVRPYDLSRLPLFRVKLVKINSAENDSLHYLLVDIHHIISDGVSAAIIIKEMNALYAGQELPELKIQYRDYCAWHEKLLSSDFIKAQKSFWKKELSGELPVLDLPGDYPRPLKFNPEGKSVHFQAGRELADRLTGLARENKVTLYTVLLSAYYVLLSKYSGQSDIIVGTPVAGRIHEDTNGIVGIFLNTLALRNYPEPEKVFADFLKEVGNNCIRAFDNQDYPFDSLVEDLNLKRDTARNPVFSTMFVMQNMNVPEVKGRGIKTSRYDIKNKMAQVDITVNVTENKDGIDFEVNYCTHLFSSGTIKRFINHYLNILKFVADNSKAKLSQIEMMSEEEKAQIIFGFNDTQRDYDITTLHALFEKQAAATPDKIAIVVGGRELSYGELNKRANMLARTLIKKGVRPDDVVGILVDPSFEMATAILAILKAGGAYLPINTSFPEERIEFMLNDSACQLVLADPKYVSKIKKKVDIIDLYDKENYASDSANLGKTSEPNNLAYVIYTSGTTGTPKGVMVEHKSIAQTLLWRADEYKLSERDCVLQLFSYSFDGFLTSFFTSIISGAKVALLEKNMEKDPDAIKRQIIAHKVTHFISVPVLYSAILDRMSPDEMKSLRIVTLAGDKAPFQLIKRSKDKAPNLELVNEYGPTESTVVASIYRNLTEDTNTIIGKPAANTKIYILSKSGNLQPIGVPGELCISGSRLARGYLNRQDLTDLKFVSNPFVPGERLYKTGDLGKWLPDGNIEFLGRVDFQVKIRGYRVEPAEIEAELLKHKAVKEAVVLDRTDNLQNKYLCAYIVLKEDISIMQLRNFLSKSLPEYMIPAKFVKLDTIPLSPNGKVDRRALPEPSDTLDIGEKYVKPESKIESEIEKAWEEVLGIKNIGTNLNFFEIGGDSMKIINLHSKLDKLYPGILTVTDLFSYPSISKQAAYIENSLKDELPQFESKVKEQPAAENAGDIAIIGISVNMPLARDKDEFWNNIKNKVDCIRDFPENRRRDADAMLKAQNRDTSGLEYERMAYLDEIDKFDCEFFGIAPKEADLMDPNQRLFLQTAWAAIEDSGYGGDKLRGSRTGVYVGFCGESDYGRYIAETSPEDYVVAAPGNLTPVIASRISYLMDFKGPSVIINTACSSSLVAIHYACCGIRNGECDIAIAGGVKVWLYSIKNQYKMGIESEDAVTRSFDDNSNGTAKGEGVAAIVLKPLDKAIRDRDSIYAVIKGSFINQDGASNGLTAPSPTAQAEVISKAWENASIDPKTISYIEAHGTGTRLGDPIEIDGITKAFRKYTKKKQFCAISAIKSNIGHLDNAAGVAGVVKAALALSHRQLPASIHFSEPNRAIDFINSPVYVNDRTRHWDTDGSPRRCGVSAFGLSGTNCHIVLEEAPAPQNDAQSDEESLNILTLSAKAKESLIELADSYIRAFPDFKGKDCKDLCYTLNTGRGHYNFRAAVVLRPDDSLRDKLAELKAVIENGANVSGVFYGEINNFGDKESTEKANDLVKALAESSMTDEEKLCDICRLYVSGADVNWDALYAGKNLRRVHAPTYPFLRRRCWIDLPDTYSEGIDDMYYTVCWHKKALVSDTESLSKRSVLVITDGTGIFDEFISVLKAKAKTLIKAQLGSQFSRVDENYIIDGTQKDYERLVKDVEEYGISTVVYLLSFTGNKTINSAEELEEVQNSHSEGLLYLVKALGNTAENKIELVIVSDNVNEVTGRESRINPENAITFGMGKCIGMEYENIRCRMIDFDEHTDAAVLVKELCNEADDWVVAYRDGERYVDVIEKVDKSALNDSGIPQVSEGVCLITGGTGRLGLKAAKLIASKGKANIALVSRTPVPDRTEWDNILAEGADKRLCSVINTVREIEKSGSKVRCWSCDITSAYSLSNLLAELRREYGRIGGVIHCAAVGVGSGGALINQETWESVNAVLLPKVRGTWLLDKLTRQDKPDYFVMYSSGITLIGGYCSCSYTAANSYLDSFAAARNRSGLRTLAIDWPVWENDQLKYGVYDKNLMFKILPIEKGLQCLDELMHKDIARVIVGEMNFESEILTMEGRIPLRLSDELKTKLRTKTTETKPVLSSKTPSYDAAGSDTEKMIAQIFADVLGYERVGKYDNFFELGGNSLLAIKAEAIASKRNLNFSYSDIYKYQTVEQLAAFIDDSKNTVSVQSQMDNSEISRQQAAATITKKSSGKIIENIEPFNDIFYKLCFYNSFFPVVIHFGKSILPFLINDIAVYAKYPKDGERAKLDMEYVPAIPIESVLSEEGMVLQTKNFSENIIGDITAALDENKPVIVWVDCFYESIRTDLYKNKHWSHTVLIYGYDEAEKTFNIIEHSFRDSLLYKKQVISFEDIYNMTRGYMEYFYSNEKQPVLYAFSKSKSSTAYDNSSNRYFQIYKNNILNNQNLMADRLECLKDFIFYFDRIISDKNEFFKNGNKLIESFNSVINAKNADKYKFEKMANKNLANVYESLNEITEMWSDIRRVTAKIFYSEIYNYDKLYSVSQKLRSIYKKEREYIKLLVSSLNNSNE